MTDETKPISVDVLAERMAGLMKATDLSFVSIKESLARIELAAANYVQKNELEEVKKDFINQIADIKNGFSKHNEDDKMSFGLITKKLDFLMKMVFLGTGIIIAAEFGIQIWSNLHK